MSEQALQDAIKAMELLDLYLNDSQLQREKNFDLHHPPEGMRQQSKLAVSGDILQKESEIDGSAELYLRGLVSFGLRFVSTDSSGNEGEQETLAELTSTFAVVYRMEHELTDEAIHEFIQHNMVHNAWPFWREHAIRTFSEAKLPRPQIGLFKPSPTA